MGGSIEQQDDVPTSSMTIAVRIIVLVLAIPTTLLYLRKFVLNNFGLDDWLVLVALIGVDLFSALAYIITYYGLGRPMKYVPTDHLVVFLTLEYASQCAYLVIAATVKASLLIFIMRLFPTRFVHIAGKALLGIIAAFTLSGTLALVFQCRPVQAAYDKAIANSSCYPTETSYAILMMQGVIMFVLDVSILVLPIRPIWQLQMPIRRRILVLGLLCIDSASTSLIWMEIEFNLGLMSGSLPSLRKLFKLGSLFPTSRSTKTQQSYTSDFELHRHSWTITGITKKTEIQRAYERSESQEFIAPIYGQGELTTTTKAYADGETSSASNV
ncbi:hypothetical protein AnigIFM63604_001963 [Aspergillus niger]|uniref:Rhodopsin domain-containing protein n=1 Tax=Aspergillus niger TaxID=5061 RepID=A0A9W6EG74_ASPNG|nr:hypothetical protein AnigIFM63604_001963 [Aspergillus niger]